MTEINIEARFKSLQREADSIKSLLAQERMKQRRSLSDQPTILNSDNFTDADLKNKYTIFQMRAQEIRYILDHKIIPSITKRKSEILRRRLQKIEARIKKIGSFIKP
jgi:hypothetical protein